MNYTNENDKSIDWPITFVSWSSKQDVNTLTYVHVSLNLVWKDKKVKSENVVLVLNQTKCTLLRGI